MQDKPRLIILTDLFFPEQTSTGHLLTELAEVLAHDFIVVVLTGPATNFFKSVPAPRFEKLGNVEIHRCWGTVFDKNYLLGRGINLLTRSMSLSLKAFGFIQPTDVVLVVTNPPTLPLVAATVCRFNKAKLITLIHDLYPEVLSAAGVVSETSFISRVLSYLTNRAFRFSSAIIVLGRDMKRRVEARLPDQKDSICVIPNWAEAKLFPTAKRENALLHELNLTEKFVVLYAGNMGRTHDLETIVEAAKSLRDDPLFHFVFLGFGAKEPWLQHCIQTQSLANISYLPPRPRSEQQDFLNACDVAVISFEPGMSGISVPSRLYNQMKVGRPIIAIADSDSELALTVCEEEIGIVICPKDVMGLTSALKRLARSATDCDAMGRRAARAATERYSLRAIGAEYSQLISRV